MTTGMDNRTGNREQEVSTISRSLKAIAKELDVPIIALSQLNRSVEMRAGDKRPQLSDLRESGAIEQDADMVIFIHRPEKYGITEDENGKSLIGLAEIIIAKHRNGPIDEVQLKFIKDMAKFTEFEGDIFNEPPETNGSVIYGSKMNSEKSKNDDINANENFDSEDQPF